MFVVNVKNKKKLKNHIFRKKTLSIPISYSKRGHEYKRIFKKEEESIEVLKILCLINNKEECQRLYNHAWGKHELRI